MNNDIYLHGLNNGIAKYCNIKDQKRLLKDILESDKVLSPRKQGIEFSRGFNGLDHISLCDYSRKDTTNHLSKNYNSYYRYIRYAISLGFPKNSLIVKEPILIDICEDNLNGYILMDKLGGEYQRYSDMPDEVQVRDEIPLDSLSLVTFPVNTFMKTKHFISDSSRIKIVKKHVEEIKKLLNDYNRLVSIYDIDSMLELDEKNIESLILRRHFKR